MQEIKYISIFPLFSKKFKESPRVKPANLHKQLNDMLTFKPGLCKNFTNDMCDKHFTQQNDSLQACSLPNQEEI